MPTLMLHTVIALLRLLHGGRLTRVSFRDIVRTTAYVRAQMCWLQLCTEPVEVVECESSPQHTATPSYRPSTDDRRDEEKDA